MIYLINPPSDFLIDDKSNMPLGLLFLHSHLIHNGFPVEIVDLAGLKPEEWVIPSDGEIYGITATTPQFEAAVKIARLVKQSSNIVVLGGVHATCAPGESLDAGPFDAVVIGEGEQSLLEIVQQKHIHGIDGVKPRDVDWEPTSRSFQKCIDKFPYPIMSAIDYKSYNCGVFTTEDGDVIKGTQIITSRGCPSNCSFCCSPHIYKRKVRFHTGKYMEDWIEDLVGHGFNNFYVVDDTILLNPRRLRELCEIFKSHNSRWRACVRGDSVNEKNIRMLYESGCRQVDIGVETGSQKLLDSMQKGETVEDNARAIRLAHNVGIKVKSCLIVGLPGETQEDVNQTIDFIEKNKPDSVTLCTFIPFPGCDVFFNPGKYNYKIDNSKSYNKYVCCGADAMVESVAVDEVNEATKSFRKQLLDAIQNRSTNAVLKNRVSGE